MAPRLESLLKQFSCCAFAVHEPRPPSWSRSISAVGIREVFFGSCTSAGASANCHAKGQHQQQQQSSTIRNFLKSSLRPLWRRCSRGAEDPSSAKTSSPFPSDSRRANRAPTHGAGDAAQRFRASAHEFVGDYYPCAHEIRRERERDESVLFAQRLQTDVRFISNVTPGWVPPAPCMIPTHRRR